MPRNLFYTMVQKSQKWPKTQIKGGSCLKPRHSDVKLYKNYAVQGLCLFNQLCAAWCCVWLVKLWLEV